MVSLEGYRIRETKREVGKYSKPPVPHGFAIAKGTIVGDLMNRQSHGVTNTAPEHVRPEDHPLPVQVLNEVEGSQLRQDHQHNHPDQVVVWLHQRLYLGMLSYTGENSIKKNYLEALVTACHPNEMAEGHITVPFPPPN